MRKGKLIISKYFYIKNIFVTYKFLNTKYLLINLQWRNQTHTILMPQLDALRRKQHHILGILAQSTLPHHCNTDNANGRSSLKMSTNQNKNNKTEEQFLHKGG